MTTNDHRTRVELPESARTGTMRDCDYTTETERQLARIERLLREKRQPMTHKETEVLVRRVVYEQLMPLKHGLNIVGFWAVMLLLAIGFVLSVLLKG